MSELNEKNYIRICLINWLLTVPLMILFAWPYYFACSILNTEAFLSIPSSLIFATPFMLTILHGHVTMALGSVHRHHYYSWLESKPLSFGLFFHEVFVSTRFRLILLILSLIILPLSMLF